MNQVAMMNPQVQRVEDVENWNQQFLKDNIIRGKSEDKAIVHQRAEYMFKSFPNIPTEHLEELFDEIRKTSKYKPTYYDVNDCWNEILLPRINAKRVGDIPKWEKDLNRVYDIQGLDFASIILLEQYPNIGKFYGDFMAYRLDQHKDLLTSDIPAKCMVKKIAEIEAHIIYIKALRDNLVDGCHRLTKELEVESLIALMERQYTDLYQSVVDCMKNNKNPYRKALGL